MSSKHTNGNKQKESSLPSINQTLGNLPKYHDKLEFYKNQLKELIADHNIIEASLELLKKTIYSQNNLKEKELEDLQKALSDMTVALFNEKHRYLKLQNENDRLMLKHFENKKKIETLLKLTNLSENEINYFFKVPKSHPNRNTQKTSSTNSHKANYDRSNSYKNSLQNELETLNAHLAEQQELSKIHIETLKEDYKIRQLEIQSRKNNERVLIYNLSDKLHSAHKMIFEKNKLLFDLIHSLEQNGLSDSKNVKLLKGILKKKISKSSNLDKESVKKFVIDQNDINYNNKHHKKKDGIIREEAMYNIGKKAYKDEAIDYRETKEDGNIGVITEDSVQRTNKFNKVNLEKINEESSDYYKRIDNGERKDNGRRVKKSNSKMIIKENEQLQKGQYQGDCQSSNVICRLPPILKNGNKGHTQHVCRIDSTIDIGDM